MGRYLRSFEVHIPVTAGLVGHQTRRQVELGLRTDQEVVRHIGLVEGLHIDLVVEEPHTGLVVEELHIGLEEQENHTGQEVVRHTDLAAVHRTGPEEELRIALAVALHTGQVEVLLDILGEEHRIDLEEERHTDQAEVVPNLVAVVDSHPGEDIVDFALEVADDNLAEEDVRNLAEGVLRDISIRWKVSCQARSWPNSDDLQPSREG